MYLKIKRIVLIGIFCCFGSYLFAQQQDEFRAEIGILGGVAYYIGDANSIPFNNLTPAYGALFRYKFTPRFAARAEFTRTSVFGGGFVGVTVPEFPDYIHMVDARFDNPINVLDFAGEFNFFDLERSLNRRTSRIFSPYIFVGVGMMNYLYEGNEQFTLSLPFGVGIKLKLGQRFNFNAQFSNRLLFADNLEGISDFNNPRGLNGSNFLNNDMLSTLTIGITYNIWRRCPGCVQH